MVGKPGARMGVMPPITIRKMCVNDAREISHEPHEFCIEDVREAYNILWKRAAAIAHTNNKRQKCLSNEANILSRYLERHPND